MSAPDAATVAAVLAEHVSQVGPISGAWRCPDPCGVTSTDRDSDGYPAGRSKRAAEHRAHLAAAVLASEPIAQALAAIEAVARVEALAESRPIADCEWGCGDELRAALRPEGGNQ